MGSNRRLLAYGVTAAATAAMTVTALAAPGGTPGGSTQTRAPATAKTAAHTGAAGTAAHPFLPTTGRQHTVILAPDGRVLAVPKARAADAPPHPDPAFLDGVPGSSCVPDNPYEKRYVLAAEKLYGNTCKRINFAFGPVQVRPGQNNAMLQPVTIEKPWYDGYIVRFKPDLLRSVDGSKPHTEDLHLHHGTWLNLNRSYGDGPFFASGEEKTIANFPPGYGMEVRAGDAWGLLYMVHDATAQPDSVWITYQIDFVAKADADKKHIVPVKPLWLDVQKNRIAKDAPDTGANPVFNVQKGFGHIDHDTKTRVCRWPDENCARFDVYGNVTRQQGKPDPSNSIKGQDYVVPKDMAGTIIGLGGHLHPGGIRDEVSVVRHGVEKPIFWSDAVYWNYKDPRRGGALPTSWDFSMTVTGSPLGWKVKVKPGDIIRLNAVYDSQLASWYENMGIVVAYVAPKDPIKPAGVDMFTDHVAIHPGVAANAMVPSGPWMFNFTPQKGCHNDLVGRDGQKDICLRGQVTHGAKPESGNAGEPCTPDTCPPLPKKDGQLTTDIHAAAFTYGQADLGVIGSAGIPLVKVGQPVRFWNEDAAANIWHTFTRCKEPCTGPTRINYPLADGGSGSTHDLMDFESMEIGYGLMWEPPRSQVGGNDPYDGQWVQDGLEWEFTPTRPGVYSFYCRIHPGMRGAIKAVK